MDVKTSTWKIILVLFQYGGMVDGTGRSGVKGEHRRIESDGFGLECSLDGCDSLGGRHGIHLGGGGSLEGIHFIEHGCTYQ
jgi:hypothetical protein